MAAALAVVVARAVAVAVQSAECADFAEFADFANMLNVLWRAYSNQSHQGWVTRSLPVKRKPASQPANQEQYADVHFAKAYAIARELSQQRGRAAPLAAGPA